MCQWTTEQFLCVSYFNGVGTAKVYICGRFVKFRNQPIPWIDWFLLHPFWNLYDIFSQISEQFRMFTIKIMTAVWSGT